MKPNSCGFKVVSAGLKIIADLEIWVLTTILLLFETIIALAKVEIR
jgi:hypothetical protein